MSFVTPPIDTDLHSENYVLMSTHGGGCARGCRRCFSCRQLVAALLATVPFLSQLRTWNSLPLTVTSQTSLLTFRRQLKTALTAPTPDSSLTAICFCFLLDIVTSLVVLFTKRHVKSFFYNNNNNNSAHFCSTCKVLRLGSLTCYYTNDSHYLVSVHQMVPPQSEVADI